jgi:Helix-turn-helix domain
MEGWDTAEAAEGKMVAPQQKVSLRALRVDEQTELERIGKAQNERVDRVQRAGALLAVARGQSFAAAARQVGFRRGGTIAELVSRFNACGLAALNIARGRGRKPTYGASARAHIVATAQRLPDRRQDGTVSWSLRL